MNMMESLKALLPNNMRRWLGAKRIEINRFFRQFNYLHVFTPKKSKEIRKKSRIDVNFVVFELGMWKTENLYLRMFGHRRFNPVITVVDSPEHPGSYKAVIDYLNKKGYDFKFIDKDTNLQEACKADIIFYQKPYAEEYFPAHSWKENKSALFCYCPYFVHDSLIDWLIDREFQNICWQNYFENFGVAREIGPRMHNKGKNILVTGLPMFDQFLKPIESYQYSWKPQGKHKKKIIYAPHFTISKYLKRSTFLENGEFMLEMAEKYKYDVQFVFKPHPLLYKNLVDEWGEAKSREYYDRWDAMDNGQLELGQYADLFMTSDAMIHDCGSFATEYIFTGKPVMFLYHEASAEYVDNRTQCGTRALALHYRGDSHEDIERFIKDVINDNDPLREERLRFFNENLKLANGKDSCENIIEAILENKAEFKI